MAGKYEAGGEVDSRGDGRPCSAVNRSSGVNREEEKRPEWKIDDSNPLDGEGQSPLSVEHECGESPRHLSTFPALFLGLPES